jgi:alkylation response protein AidB-like acyl-CoA dehydrogenase
VATPSEAESRSSGRAVTTTRAAVEQEVLAWFHSAWDPDLSLLEWRERLVASGWAVPSWTASWFGRDLPAWVDALAHGAIRAAGGVAVPLGGGMALAAPTIYDHGSDDLKQRFLRRTITGELVWCQLFSEPGAGSDLAGLRATAVRDGDEWVVSGQKVWNTSADHADMALLVARTDWDVPKHAGITYFCLDMHQPGVEVRPIEQMNGHASFTEVYLTEARIPAANVVGAIGGGWKVARGTLAHERSFARQRTVHFAPSATGRVIDEAKAETADYLRTYEWYPQRMGRADLIPDRARASGAAADPVHRQRIADVVAFERAAAWTAARAHSNRAQGRPPGSEGSIGKLALSELARRCNGVHSTIAGASAMLREGDDPVDSVIAEVLVSTPAQSIAGGTDEIQHTIVGENVLGLLKEPAVDRDLPFRDVGRTAGR